MSRLRVVESDAGGHQIATLGEEHAAGVLDVVAPHEVGLQWEPMAINHIPVNQQRHERGEAKGHQPAGGSIDYPLEPPALGPGTIHRMHAPITPDDLAREQA